MVYQIVITRQDGVKVVSSETNTRKQAEEVKRKFEAANERLKITYGQNHGVLGYEIAKANKPGMDVQI